MQSLLTILNAEFAGLVLVVALAVFIPLFPFLAGNRDTKIGPAQSPSPRLKILLIAALSSTLLLGGCKSYFSSGWRYSCTGVCNIPVYQAKSKCIAQANAAYTDIVSKRSIALSCLAGEGYTRKRCQVGEANCTQALGDPFGY